jgi:hypothetical protein
MSPWGKYPVYKTLLDLSMVVCFGKTHRCAKECLRTGAIPNIPTMTGFWRIKKPLKKCLVHSPALKNWIEICEKDTSAFGRLSGKFHLYLPPSEEMANFTLKKYQ